MMSTATIGRPTHGNLARPSGMHSGSVPMMTTASIVRWPPRRHQACRVEGESWRHVTSEEAGLGVAPHSAPQPVGSWRPATIAWTGAFSRAHSVRIPPSAVSGSPAPPWVAGSPVVFLVATLRWPPAAALPVWTLWSAVPREDRHLGALKVVFCLQAQAGHFGRLVGTATPLREHRRPRPVRASAHLSWVLVGAGVTPAVHSHGPAPLAPVVVGDRRCAHGRVNSDRAVDRPCSRLIRPQGPHPRTAAWRACPRRSHAVGCCWLTDTQWTASSTAGRLRRPGGSVKATPAGKYVPNARQSKRAAHTPPTGPVCVLLYCPHTC